MTPSLASTGRQRCRPSCSRTDERKKKKKKSAIGGTRCNAAITVASAAAVGNEPDVPPMSTSLAMVRPGVVEEVGDGVLTPRCMGSCRARCRGYPDPRSWIKPATPHAQPHSPRRTHLEAVCAWVRRAGRAAADLRRVGLGGCRGYPDPRPWLPLGVKTRMWLLPPLISIVLEATPPILPLP